MVETYIRDPVQLSWSRTHTYVPQLMSAYPTSPPYSSLYLRASLSSDGQRLAVKGHRGYIGLRVEYLKWKVDHWVMATPAVAPLGRSMIGGAGVALDATGSVLATAGAVQKGTDFRAQVRIFDMDVVGSLKD
jgi:hypothetical protein